MSRPKFEKVFMVVLPCTAVLIAVLMLAPQLSVFLSLMKESYEASYPVEESRFSTASFEPEAERFIPKAAEPSPSPSPTPKPIPSPTPDLRRPVRLKASSTEKDMHIRILDENGNTVNQEGIFLKIEYPNGESYEYASNAQGTFYLSGLAAGDYKLRAQESVNYLGSDSIFCTVKEHVEYKQIENIAEIVIVQDVSDIYTEELTYTDIPAQLVPEVIVTPEEAVGENNVIVEEKPVIDENGYQKYSYTFNTGPNGFLILKETGEESNVVPVDENGDGVPEYGLYEESEGYYMSEFLYNLDNTPVDKFDITATAITETIETTVGWQNIDGNMYYYDSNGVPVKGLKEIDGSLYYFNQFGVRASRLGIDVSYYNEDINWQAVKANGIDFAIIRAGGRTWEKGNLYFDTRFSEYIKGAKAAGVKVGVYFYSTAINEVEAVQEASVTLDLLGGQSLDLPVFIDMEYSGMYPDARMDNLTIPERSAIANAFCKTIIDSGYQAGVYSGQYYFDQSMDHSAISDYNIWIASYTTDNKLPNYKHRYDMWQFTDSGKVSGIEGGVDMNVIF